MNSNKVTKFTDKALNTATGLCVLDNDDVLVCGDFSHNVVQFRSDGRKLGVQLQETDGIQFPQSLCWDSVHSRLIVTMYDSDTIKVYNLKMPSSQGMYVF